VTLKTADRVAVGAMAIATAVFFWDALLMRGTFFVQDVMVQNYPFRDFFAKALKDFQFPLWHPGINGGFPLFAEGQAGALYPLNLLLGLLSPTHVGLNLSVILHTWIAAAGTYGFLRVLRCVPSAAMTAAVTYAFSGFLIVRAMSQNYQAVAAWFPVLFLLVELALNRRRPWAWIGLMTAVVGLQFLAGHPQATVYGLVAVSLYGVIRGLTTGARYSHIVAFVAVPAMGAAVAAVQLLPTWELVQLSGRGDGLSWETFVSMSMPPERLITLLLPNFYGNSSLGTYWAQEQGFFIQLCPYIGIIPLFLCLSAARNRTDVPTVFFVALCVLALLLSLGKYTTLYELIYQLPGLSSFRIPTRFLLWWALGGAVLAGLGLDRILGGEGGSTSIRRSSRGWTVVWGTILMVGLGSMLWLNRHALPAEIGQWLTSSLEADTPILRFSSELVWDLLRLIAMTAAAFIVFLWFPRGKRRSWAWGVAALVFVDLYGFGVRFNPLIPVEAYTRVPTAARVMLERTQAEADSANWSDLPPAAGFRFVSLISERSSPYDWHSGWAVDNTSYLRYPETLRMYSGSLYGLANTLPGWSPLHLRRQWQFVRGHPQLLPIANSRFQISHKKLQDNKLTKIHDGIVKVYEDPTVLPRAFVVEADTVIAEALARIRFMRSDEFDPAKQVVLSQRPWEGRTHQVRSAAGSDGAHAARITLYQPEEVHVDLGHHGEGLLVLSDTHYPGWRAWVDGREVPIGEANHVFRAVPVKTGDREVVFRFESMSFRVGAGISLLSVLLVLFGVWKAPISVEEAGRPEVEIGAHIRHWVVQLGLIIVLHALTRLWPQWMQAAERASMPMGWGGG